MGTEKIKEEIKDLWTNTIKIFFDLLLKLNIDYIKLIGANGDDYGNEIIYIDSIVEGVSRLIPMKAAKNTKKLSIDYCGIIHLLKNNINYVESDLHEIINNNKKALFNIKMIRNNIEHNPHCLMGCTGKIRMGILI